MTIWAIISLLVRWLGFIRWADGLWEKHEAMVKAKEIANAPITDSDWLGKAKDGDL